MDTPKHKDGDTLANMVAIIDYLRENPIHLIRNKEQPDLTYRLLPSGDFRRPDLPPHQLAQLPVAEYCKHLPPPDPRWERKHYATREEILNASLEGKRIYCTAWTSDTYVKLRKDQDRVWWQYSTGAERTHHNWVNIADVTCYYTREDDVSKEDAEKMQRLLFYVMSELLEVLAVNIYQTAPNDPRSVRIGKAQSIITKHLAKFCKSQEDIKLLQKYTWCRYKRETLGTNIKQVWGNDVLNWMTYNHEFDISDTVSDADALQHGYTWRDIAPLIIEYLRAKAAHVKRVQSHTRATEWCWWLLDECRYLYRKFEGIRQYVRTAKEENIRFFTYLCPHLSARAAFEEIFDGYINFVLTDVKHRLEAELEDK